jgi:hypothetical protein
LLEIKIRIILILPKRLRDIVKILKIPMLLMVAILCLPIEPKDYAKSKTNDKDFQCLVELWNRESRWNHKAISRTQDYGIPQRHMPNHTNAQRKAFLRSPEGQIDWGLNYLRHRYSSELDASGICSGLAHSHRKGWY